MAKPRTKTLVVALCLSVIFGLIAFITADHYFQDVPDNSFAAYFISLIIGLSTGLVYVMLIKKLPVQS